MLAIQGKTTRITSHINSKFNSIWLAESNKKDKSNYGESWDIFNNYGQMITCLASEWMSTIKALLMMILLMLI